MAHIVEIQNVSDRRFDGQLDGKLYPLEPGEIRSFEFDVADHFCLQSIEFGVARVKVISQARQATPVAEKVNDLDIVVCGHVGADGKACGDQFEAGSQALVNHLAGHERQKARKPKVVEAKG
ncbi:MAG: hypothetical protein AABY75_05440 [Bacteroidota bacterium]